MFIFACTNLNSLRMINFHEQLKEPPTAYDKFEKMLREGCWPNDITYHYQDYTICIYLSTSLLYLNFKHCKSYLLPSIFYSRYIICLSFKNISIHGYSIMRDQNYSWGLQDIAKRGFWRIWCYLLKFWDSFKEIRLFQWKTLL